MRRIGAILSLSILITLIFTSTCFAAGFELIDSYPSDGEKGMMPTNVGIKLFFNENISSPKVQKLNEECFSLVDSKNKKVPIKAYYSQKKPNNLLLVVEKDLQPKEEYKFVLSGDFQSTNGSFLAEKKVINFKIRDTSTDTNGYMILMGVMVVGMIFFTSRVAKKEVKKAQKEALLDSKTNPYKLAKETGKPVEQIVEKLEKEKEKVQRKKAKQGGGSNKETDTEDDNEALLLDVNHYRAKAARPISASGSKYITGRKAEAEKARAAAKAAKAAKSTNPKNSSGKSKNKNKKK